MKKSFLVTVLSLALVLPAFAELTVQDASSKDYLNHHGHSAATINAVQKSIAQTNGEALEDPIENEYYNRPRVKFFRKLYMWIDPSVDDHSFMNHSINTSPRYDDL